MRAVVAGRPCSPRTRTWTPMTKGQGLGIVIRGTGRIVPTAWQR